MLKFVSSLLRLAVYTMMLEKIMTTRQTGGLSQGYKPKLPASA